MRESVIIKDWPFEKGEKAQLTWIGEPFKYNNKWMFYAYFKGDKNKVKIMLDWASIHFLAIDKFYVNGDLNNGLDNEDSEIIDINLNGIKPEYKEKDWTVWGTGFYDKYKSKTFNFTKNGRLYCVPLIEIIRAVLAPNRFMLNRMLEPDGLDNYFTYDIDKYKMDIYFTSLYRYKDLNREKINHIAWIITNPQIIKMFRDVGYNLLKNKELKLDFLFENFNIRARVERKPTYMRIAQIVGLYDKKINVAEVNVYHPNLEEADASNEPKKWRYINNSSLGKRELDSGVSGAASASEDINTFEIVHEYKTTPRINKKKTGRKVNRKTEDENTKSYVIEDDRLRTVADEGGDNLAMGLEFISLDNINEKSSLKEFLEILKLIEKLEEVKSVEILVGTLSGGMKRIKFLRLSDGCTERKFAVGIIKMKDGKESCLVDVERENEALSMLILKSFESVSWKLIYNKLLIKLVNHYGKWPTEDLDYIITKGIVLMRHKHITKSKYEKVKCIYEKLL